MYPSNSHTAPAHPVLGAGNSLRRSLPELHNLHPIPAHRQTPGVASGPDVTRLATAGGDGTARIYTLQMDEPVRLARSRLTRTLSAAECRQYLHVEQCPAVP